MSFWSSFTSGFSFGTIGGMFAGWNPYNPCSVFMPNITQMSLYPTMSYNFSFNGINNLGYNSVFNTQFNSQSYFNSPQTVNWSNSIYPSNQSMSFNTANISLPISFNYGFYSTSKTSDKSSVSGSKDTSSLHSLKGKNWSEMTDSQLRQIYGEYTRDITKLYEGTAEDLNKYLEGKGVLEGKGQAFIDAQNTYGISAAVLVAICMNESDKGRSDNAKNKNNVGGVRISDSNEFRTFETVDACIMEIGRFLKAGYVNNSIRPLTKLYEVNARYCPVSDKTDKSGLNSYWAKNVDFYASQIENALA